MLDPGAKYQEVEDFSYGAAFFSGYISGAGISSRGEIRSLVSDKEWGFCFWVP